MTLELILDKSLAKIIEFLLENPIMDYSKTDLAEQTGISRSTLYRKWDLLEELSIIEKTRKYQNTQLYKLDTDSEIVDELGRLKRKLEEEVENNI
ncbi:MAG: winged helix-turn-helix domain-containing protein [Candidatus Natronoplasma sp.]